MQSKRTINLQPTRLRAATAPTPRGSSSLLRLSSAVSRLPSGAAVDQWVGRASRAAALA